MMNVNASQMIRSLLVCGCVLSSGFIATSAVADGRGDGDRRTIAADRNPSSGRGPAVDRTNDSPRGNSASGRSPRSNDAPPASGRGGYFFKGGSPLQEGQAKPIPKSMWSRASGGGPRMTSPSELPWSEGPRPQISDDRARTAPRSGATTPKISSQRTQVTPRGGEVNQQVARPDDQPQRRAPEIRTDSSRVPFSAMAQADQADRNERQPRRATRSDAPRVADTPRVVETPAPANRPSVRARQDADQPSTPPVQPPVTTDQPRTVKRDDTSRRGPEVANTPDRNQPVIRNDDNGNNVPQTPANRTPRPAPVVRGDSQGPKAPSDVDRPVTRSREDIARSIARPSNIPDNSRNSGSQGNIARGAGNTAGSPERGLPISRPGTDVARTRTNTAGSTPVVRSSDDVARSIARPPVGSGRVTRQPSDSATRTNTNVGRGEPITRSRTDSARGSVTGDHSLPISRTRDDVARSTTRSPIGGDRTITRDTTRTVPDIARAPRGIDRPGMGRNASSPGTSRIARDTSPRTFDRTTRGVGRDNTPLARSTAREDSVRSASAVRRDGTIRTASFRDTRTVAHGKIGGQDIYVRTAYHHGHNRDVVVINAGHFRPHRWPHGDYRPYHGGWHHNGWHHGDWHHGHHVDFGVSFTFVHSYCAPAGVFYYDVVPVAPVVYTAPVYSLDFAYVGRHHGVVVSSVRYVEPVFFAPPTMVVYPTVYAAPVVAPVVFSPIVAAPVVAPVPVPVVTPVYAPMYYYYPAYAYYPVYSAVVAPAYVVEPAPVPVVAAPAVVEAPSSGWSVSTAFSFLGHHGKSFSLGGSFTKVKSAPAVVAAPAAVAPAVAVEPAPAEAAPAAEVTLEAGLAAIRGGNMEQARDILSQVVISDPDNGMARMLYSAALMADGQYKEAAESLRRSFETWPDFQLKDFYLPAVYDNPKVFTQTMRDVREFLSDHPERTDAWLLVAWSYAVSGQSNEATMLLGEAQKSWPDDSTFASLDKAVQANNAAEQASASAG